MDVGIACGDTNLSRLTLNNVEGETVWAVSACVLFCINITRSRMSSSQSRISCARAHALAHTDTRTHIGTYLTLTASNGPTSAESNFLIFLFCVPLLHLIQSDSVNGICFRHCVRFARIRSFKLSKTISAVSHSAGAVRAIYYYYYFNFLYIKIKWDPLAFSLLPFDCDSHPFSSH